MKKILIVLVVLFISSFLISCTIEDENIVKLSTILKQDAKLYKKLSIMDGTTGDKKETEDQEVINRLIDDIEDYSLIELKDDFLNGYKYSICVSDIDNKVKLCITDNEYAMVNGKNYTVVGSIDYEKYFNMIK